jgi:uncharacterized protein (TIGR02058 family)
MPRDLTSISTPNLRRKSRRDGGTDVSTVDYVLEFGMGVDLHGGDCTKAACRAAFDALRHSSLPLLRDIESRGGTMLVDVTVAVPQPESVDLARVKQEFPHGEVTVHAVSGGLHVPGRETFIACASIAVSGKFPD